MSLSFLHTDNRNGTSAPVARSSMEGQAERAGARLELRDGWSVAVAFTSAEAEAADAALACGWADVSHLGKLELQAEPAELEEIVSELAGGVGVQLGRAAQAQDAWWCPITRGRLLVICEPAQLAPLRSQLAARAQAVSGFTSVIDVTTVSAALAVVGPLAREVIARFCALDLRPHVAPVGSVRPGSIARQPGVVVRQAQERYLLLFGWALGEYVWSQVEEAAGSLGGGPIGLDALARLHAPLTEASGA